MRATAKTLHLGLRHEAAQRPVRMEDHHVEFQHAAATSGTMGGTHESCLTNCTQQVCGWRRGADLNRIISCSTTTDFAIFSSNPSCPVHINIINTLQVCSAAHRWQATTGKAGCRHADMMRASGTNRGRQAWSCAPADTRIESSISLYQTSSILVAT